MNRMRSISIMIAVMMLCIVFAASPVLADGGKMYSGKPAKYVFLFIGDGVGLPQITAAEKYAGRNMLISTFPAQGFTTTYAADRFITDSAASATALACGQKTNCGVVGMTAEQKSVKTIAEIAKEMGWKVGVVSSVSIDHATPASFYAHVPSRNQYHDIDHALVKSGFDFFGGGGLKDPVGKRVLKADPNAKTLGDAVAEAKKAGYKLVTKKSDIMALKAGDKAIAINEWLQDSGAMPYVMDMTDKDVTLPEFTAKAIDVLSNDKGFFLMVEGGKIDWACHANDGTASILNTLAFDDSVKVAVDFAKKHPEETLIVVTGDHECGGLTLGWAGTQYGSYFDILGSQKVSFQKFTDEIMKKYISECAGKCSFEDFKPVITENFGLKFEGDAKNDKMVLKPHQIAALENAYMQSMAGAKVKSSDPTTSLLYGGYNPMAVELTHTLNNMAGLGWTSYSHTGVPVATTASGVGSDIFNGRYDNTDVALKIMSVMGVTPKIHMAGEPLSYSVAAK